MKGDRIPPEHDVLRHCRLSDWAGNIVKGDAFIPDTDGVSVSWVQFFQGEPAEQLTKAKDVIRTTRSVRASHRLALIKVETVHRCGLEADVDLAVEHDPIAEPKVNMAHALIKGLPEDSAVLRERLALNSVLLEF